MSRCLVLGAGGFIGKNLIDELLVNGHEVVMYDRPESVKRIQETFPKATYIEGDFLMEDNWGKILQGVKVCYHLISTSLPRSSNDDPIGDVTGNVLGSLRLLEAVRKQTDNIRIVFASSGGTVYGPVKFETVNEDHPTNPICSYGITKLMIEKYLRLYKELHSVNSISLRIANPYGFWQKSDSAQGVISVFAGRILHDNVIDIWGDGSVVRDYIFVKDVVAAMLLAATYGGREVVFNIGSGKGYSLREILNSLEMVTNKKAQVVYHPPRSFDIKKSVLDVSKAKLELGWIPRVEFQDGICQTVEWLKNSFISSSKG